MILSNTDSIHTQTKENDEDTAWSGNGKHDDGFANDPRDVNVRIPIHKIVHKQNHRYIYAHII